MSLLDEYTSDPVAAWEKIHSKLMRVHVAEGSADEVRAVADELVRRVRHNLSLLAERLRESGYVFAEPERALVEPPDSSELLLADLDQLSARCETQGHRGKPLAPILRSWYTQVGCVDFTGYHPDWPAPEVKAGKDAYAGSRFMTDALVVNALDDLRSDLEERLADGETWSVGFSPDIFHKADVSGGAMYQFDLIAARADVLCFGIDKLFVPYLRDVMKWSGFPGFRYYKNAPKKWLKELGKELLEF